MKYKLVDVKNKVEEDVNFGTCDLCEYVGTHYYDILIFEDENGKRYEEENGSWSWGDYMIDWNIDNYVKFASFITGKEFSSPEKDYYGEWYISHAIGEMYEAYDDDRWNKKEEK